MKITKIEVNNLFGVFKHVIPLNEGGITIVIGENGLGKTVILEAVNAFFGQNYNYFLGLDFQSIIFHFDNEEIWEITKKPSDKQVALMISRTTFDKPEKKSKPVAIAKLDVSGDAKLNRHSNSKREWERLKYESMLDDERIRYLEDSSDNMILRERMLRDRMMHERLIHERMYGSLYDLEVNIPKWFTEASNKINVKLIETQRIITAKVRGGEAYIRTVQKSSNELKDNISFIEKSASNIALNLDSTYPNRLIQKLKQNSAETFDELNDALQKLADRRKLLSSTGIILSTKDSDLLQISKNDEGLIDVLKLYIDDSNEKLAPYDDISARIKLFMGILNKRFKHKTLEVTKDDGFVFLSTIIRNSKGEFAKIPPMSLSSGEQNELILFYELIFKSNPGDMILIDEPELSLHISWQNKFINDLKEVSSINKVTIVIATHSPDIIDENWDLKVELEGLE